MKSNKFIKFTTLTKTAAIFVFVMIAITALSGCKGDEITTESITDTSEAETETTECETTTEFESVALLDISDDDPDAPDNADDVTDSGEVLKSLDELKLADTSWAYFMVNRTNPIPEGYESELKSAPVWSDGRNYYFDARITDVVKRMIADAKNDGVSLLVCSAYRSHKKQTANFESQLSAYAWARYDYATAYRLTAGYIAVPGTSEHQTGLAVDFITPGYRYLNDGFEDTDAYAWLAENSYKYGFIMRYPTGKSELTGINYEPWHFRFIGFEYAEDIYNSGLCLEEYMEQDESCSVIPMTELVIPSRPSWYDTYANRPIETEAETTEDTTVEETTVEETTITETTVIESDTLEIDTNTETDTTATYAENSEIVTESFEIPTDIFSSESDTIYFESDTTESADETTVNGESETASDGFETEVFEETVTEETSVEDDFTDENKCESEEEYVETTTEFKIVIVETATDTSVEFELESEVETEAETTEEESEALSEDFQNF